MHIRSVFVNGLERGLSLKDGYLIFSAAIHIKANLFLGFIISNILLG